GPWARILTQAEVKYRPVVRAAGRRGAGDPPAEARLQKEAPTMARKQDAPSPRPVTDADVDPRYRWDRPLQAPGHTQVDFEERVDFRRLHAYRLGRARQALGHSGLGALLMFDQYNIRYLSGTVIGEWARDGQQVMLEARMLKSQDELTLLNMAAAMVDGVYQDIFEALKPGARENEIVGLATRRLYEMGSDCVEAINAISGERCSPHPHNFTDRIIRPGDQAFFDIIMSYVGYRTCYYRT